MFYIEWTQAYINLNQRLRDISRRLDHLIGRPTAPPPSDSFQWPLPTTTAAEPLSLKSGTATQNALMSPPRLMVTLSGPDESKPLTSCSPPTSSLQPKLSTEAEPSPPDATIEESTSASVAESKTSTRKTSAHRHPSAATDGTSNGCRAKGPAYLETTAPMTSRTYRPSDVPYASLTPRPSFAEPPGGALPGTSGAPPSGSTLGRHWAGNSRRNDRRTLTLFSRVSSVELQVQSLARKMEVLLASMQRMEQNVKSAVVGQRERDWERERRAGVVDGNEERGAVPAFTDFTPVEKEGAIIEGTCGDEVTEG